MAIKNTDFLKGIGGFGEGFIKTLQSERERKQKELEFNQKMSFEMRQMNLLDAYRQKVLEMQGSKPFETKTGEVYPSQGGVPNFEKPLWTPPIEAKESKNEIGVLRSGWDNGFYTDYYGYKDNNGKEVITKVERRNPASSGSGSSSSNSQTTEQTTPYINFDSVDEMVRNYNKRDDKGVAVGNSIVPVDEWRIKANELLEKNLRDTGISQEVSDKIWELAGIKDNDSAVIKRKKLKNVLDQQTQLPDFQRRALYQMVEVRTR